MTDMKQIRRISEVAQELRETALIRLGKLSISQECKRFTQSSNCLPSLDSSPLPKTIKQNKFISSIMTRLNVGAVSKQVWQRSQKKSSLKPPL